MYCKHCGSVYIRAGGSNRANNPTWSCKKYKKEGVSACESPIIREEYLDKIFIDISIRGALTTSQATRPHRHSVKYSRHKNTRTYLQHIIRHNLS